MSGIMDKQKQENVKLLLQDLRNASKLIDSVSHRSHLIEQELNRSDFIRKLAEILVHIFDLESELFDIEPTLTYDFS